MSSLLLTLTIMLLSIFYPKTFKKRKEKKIEKEIQNTKAQKIEK